jgi:hypothetical protein
MFVDVNIWKHFIFFWRPTCPTWTDQFRYFEYPFFLRPYPRKRGQTKESEKNTMHYRSARKKKKKKNGGRLHIENYAWVAFDLLP